MIYSMTYTVSSTISKLKKIIMHQTKIIAMLLWGLVSSILFPVHATVVQPTDWWFWSTAIVVDNQLQISWTNENQNGDLELVVKWAVNRVLGILALIALIIVLIGWFRMLTAAWNEEQYDSWFVYMKNAALWLAIIWLAWFVVSMIFWLLNLATTEALDTRWTTLWYYEYYAKPL